MKFKDYESRLEWAACITATLLAAWLHVRNLNHAGALWRDEAGGLGLATQSTIHELWSKLHLDSFPVVMPLTLRSLVGAGADSDFALRFFGCFVGLALLATVWLIALQHGRQPPTIALSLLATNAVFIRWGDSVRAYGLGCFFILATLSMVFSLAKRPTWPGFILAAGAAILSVQTLFQNAFLLLAICCGGWMVCAKRRNWKAASQVLGIGVLSALSLLPYVKGIRESQAWWAVQKTGFIPGFVWQNLNTALGSPYDWQVWLWIAAVMAAIVLTLVWLFRREWDGRETAIYFGCTLIVALPSFLFFLWHSQMPTQIWYFLPITVLAAVCVDRTFQTSGSKRFGMLRLTLFTVLLGITIPTTRQNLAQVLTNVDLIANRVAAEASAQDLVILDPWHCGTSFRRYYNGSARWTSIPPLDDYEIQRFDQLRVRMMSGEPIKDLLAACAETLAGGHRVWMVGYGFQIPIAAPASLPPAPASVYGWRDMAYELVWSGQVFHQASMDATGVSRFTTEPALSVSGYEPLECYIFAGKREANAKP